MANLTPSPIRTIHLDPQQSRAIADRLEQDAIKVDPTLERRGLRVRYNVGNIAVDVVHPNHAVTSYVVIPRNLSTRGFAFIHGRFLYIGSTCRVGLIKSSGETVGVKGRIVSCRHLAGMTHEISVVFDDPIDLTDFVELSNEQLNRAREEYRSAAGGEPLPALTPAEVDAQAEADADADAEDLQRAERARAFAAEAHARVEALAGAAAKGDFGTALKLTTQLHDRGGELGLDLLVRVARVAREKLQSEPINPDDAKPAIDELISIARRLDAA